jgi:hypothetical protein
MKGFMINWPVADRIASYWDIQITENEMGLSSRRHGRNAYKLLVLKIGKEESTLKPWC